ncbi:unnamed protein product [Didymodactylos carnosus]|uniref:Cell division cycle protein 123 homolog n=1 Tax=Didymodactylos carnosus TaxID=1234261 RepID=A0A8S2SRJ6_9BILA|nr:unnamed protein product [Didymodactylos carnosus]CAF4248342.1 unnamed protein product [Didymodactylos carnosus]
MGQVQSSTRNDSVSKSAAKTDNNNTVTKLYEHQLLKRCEHIHFDVEAWYKILQCQTFYTEFIPISPSIAQAFVNYYQTRYNSKKLLNLNDLELIQSIQYHPKDGNPLNSQALIQLYHQELNRLQAKYLNECDSIEGKANMELIAYCYAQFHCLKVANEFEALNLILTSERIFIDLLRALDCQQVQNNKDINTNNIKLHDWSNNIIIREWNSLLDPSMEFRCFVYQSKLTAISQYNHYCKFYQLQNDLTIQQIKITIIEYWEQNVKPLLDPFKEEYCNYIIDLGLIENKLSNELECIVIELNPFAQSTGASLFDWKTDVNQLTGQLNEIEIRVRSDYLPNIDEYTKFIFEQSQLSTKDNLLLGDDDQEPYFTLLNNIHTQLTS